MKVKIDRYQLVFLMHFFSKRIGTGSFESYHEKRLEMLAKVENLEDFQNTLKMLVAESEVVQIHQGTDNLKEFVEVLIGEKKMPKKRVETPEENIFGVEEKKTGVKRGIKKNRDWDAHKSDNNPPNVK